MIGHDQAFIDFDVGMVACMPQGTRCQWKQLLPNASWRKLPQRKYLLQQ
jgi:hypothetical protein